VRKFISFPILTVLLVSIVCAQDRPPKPSLTNADIIDMAKAGLGPELILAKIRTSAIDFDTSTAALKRLQTAGVPEQVLIEMIKASDGLQDTKPTLSKEALQDRERAKETCPKCIAIMLSYVDSRSGQVTENWASKNQINWVKSKEEEVVKGKAPAKFRFTRFRENADYLVFWTTAEGFRPYVTYVPHTVTETANVSGNYQNSGNFSTYGSSGYNFGTYNGSGSVYGTVNVTRTYYQAQQNQRRYVDVVLTMFDKRGQKIFETWHQGNWAWSKPDKDCFVDAYKFLQGTTQ
jgi:hypothetical protein